MALVVPALTSGRGTPLLAAGPASVQAAPSPAQDRDSAGIQAISLANKGEAELKKLLRRSFSRNSAAGAEDFNQRAEEVLRKVASSADGEETARAALNQLRPSAQALAVKAEDTALRGRMAVCREQALSRRQNVADSLAMLEDTLLHSPSPELRGKAEQAMKEQRAALDRAEKAAFAAFIRMGGAHNPQTGDSK